jgi:ABC-type lipoprotein release transport system permease subunit
MPPARWPAVFVFPEQHDPSLVQAPFVPIVLAVTFLAAHIPARQAAPVNPVQALRCE